MSSKGGRPPVQEQPQLTFDCANADLLFSVTKLKYAESSAASESEPESNLFDKIEKVKLAMGVLICPLSEFSSLTIVPGPVRSALVAGNFNQMSEVPQFVQKVEELLHYIESSNSMPVSSIQECGFEPNDGSISTHHSQSNTSGGRNDSSINFILNQ